MSLLDTIRAGIRNKTTITWPGTDHQVQMRILSKGDIQKALFAAQRRFLAEKIEKDFTTVEALKDEETIQILFLALSDLDGKPLASSVEVFRATVTTDEVNALAKEYQEWEREVSPDVDSMDGVEFEAFLADLKKKPDETICCVRSIAFARRLLRSLVSPPAT